MFLRTVLSTIGRQGKYGISNLFNQTPIIIQAKEKSNMSTAYILHLNSVNKKSKFKELKRTTTRQSARTAHLETPGSIPLNQGTIVATSSVPPVSFGLPWYTNACSLRSWSYD